MLKLIMTKGLPASGKSTWAKEFISKQPIGTWKRVNKDDLRMMLDNGVWSKTNEQCILEVRDFLITIFLEQGYNVIVDDTNLHPKHEQKLKEIVTKKENVQFEIMEFDADYKICIERDAKRANGVGKDVIWDMWKQYCIPTLKNYPINASLPKAIISDLDGTLAIIGNRNPYNASTCEEDILNVSVWKHIQYELLEGYKLILVSGRSNKYRKQTEKWLKKNDIGYTELFMRKEDDARKDYRVKFEILENNIIPYYFPALVFDDRDQVVAMWRKNGLICFQVNDGNF